MAAQLDVVLSAAGNGYGAFVGTLRMLQILSDSSGLRILELFSDVYALVDHLVFRRRIANNLLVTHCSGDMFWLVYADSVCLGEPAVGSADDSLYLVGALLLFADFADNFVELM